MFLFLKFESSLSFNPKISLSHIISFESLLSSGVSIVPSIFRRVVLPAPEGPEIDMISP